MHSRMQPLAQRVIEFRLQLDCTVIGGKRFVVAPELAEDLAQPKRRFGKIRAYCDGMGVGGTSFLPVLELGECLALVGICGSVSRIPENGSVEIGNGGLKIAQIRR